MSAIVHDDVIYWPNGLGETECSTEYRETMDARDAVYMTGDGRTLDDLSPEDYERWNRLEDKLCNLQFNGHTGHSSRY